MARNTFATFGILAILLLSVGMVSAATEEMNISIEVTNDNSNPLDVVNGENSTFQFTINNNNASIPEVYVNFSGVNDVDYYFDEGDNISFGTPETFDVTITIPTTTTSKEIRVDVHNATDNSFLFRIVNSVHFERVVVDVPIPGCTDPAATNTNTTAVTEDNSLCTYSWCGEDFDGEEGELRITEVDITNNGQGDDDAWEYLDEITIEITVENINDDESISDVIIEIEIRDDSNNTYTKKDLDIDSLKEDVGKIGKDGDEETFTFTIDEVPIDMDEGDYRLYVRAYEDDKEDEHCASEAEDLENEAEDDTYFEFSIETSDDSALIVSNNLDNIQASCGDNNVEVTFKVYNTGSDKEEKVLVNLYNSALGIDEYRVIDNLKDGSGKEVTFFISLPQEIQRNSEELDIFLHYDYDEDENELDEFAYGESSNDEGSDFTIGLEIGTCQAPAPTIKPNLDSATKVGEELIVKTLITNNGPENDFVISISNFESWAELVSVSPQTASIEEGEFIEVMIVLTPTVAGTQSFMINSIVDGESYTQPVSVKITEEEGLFTGMNQTLIYIIIGIIAMLVLIFLVLVAKVSRRPAKPQF